MPSGPTASARVSSESVCGRAAPRLFACCRTDNRHDFSHILKGLRSAERDNRGSSLPSPRLEFPAETSPSYVGLNGEISGSVRFRTMRRREFDAFALFRNIGHALFEARSRRFPAFPEQEI